MAVALIEHAPAKVNLTLRVIARRGDGYHHIESLVAFAECGDVLRFVPGAELSLMVRGPRSAQAGEPADNLVLRATRALAERIPGIRLGAFDLDKRLPVAAGLGGGSADAAAALRLLARANGVASDDARLSQAALATGADVPVCLDPSVRVMTGIGEILSKPLDLPQLAALLVNPGVAVATKAVFAGLTPGAGKCEGCDLSALAKVASFDEVLHFLARQSNDLEAPAIALAPAIAEVLQALRALPGCVLSRMSGSGATCFGLFAAAGQTSVAEKILSAKYPHWWICATTLGSGRADVRL